MSRLLRFAESCVLGRLVPASFLGPVCAAPVVAAGAPPLPHGLPAFIGVGCLPVLVRMPGAAR